MIVTSTTPATAPMAVWTAAEADCGCTAADGLDEDVDAVAERAALSTAARASDAASDTTEASVIAVRRQRKGVRESKSRKK